MFRVKFRGYFFQWLLAIWRQATMLGACGCAFAQRRRKPHPAGFKGADAKAPIRVLILFELALLEQALLRHQARRNRSRHNCVPSLPQYRCWWCDNTVCKGSHSTSASWLAVERFRQDKEFFVVLCVYWSHQRGSISAVGAVKPFFFREWIEDKAGNSRWYRSTWYPATRLFHFNANGKRSTALRPKQRLCRRYQFLSAGVFCRDAVYNYKGWKSRVTQCFRAKSKYGDFSPSDSGCDKYFP